MNWDKFLRERLVPAALLLVAASLLLLLFWLALVQPEGSADIDPACYILFKTYICP